MRRILVYTDGKSERALDLVRAVAGQPDLHPTWTDDSAELDEILKRGPKRPVLAILGRAPEPRLEGVLGERAHGVALVAIDLSDGTAERTRLEALGPDELLPSNVDDARVIELARHHAERAAREAEGPRSTSPTRRTRLARSKKLAGALIAIALAALVVGLILWQGTEDPGAGSPSAEAMPQMKDVLSGIREAF